MPELIAQLRADPNRYRYASAGHGTARHFAAALFALNAKVDIQGLTSDGSSPALNDTSNGRAHLMFASLFSAQPWIASRKLQALAVAGPNRTPELPGVPTLREHGIEGVDVTQWYVLFAPAGTPEPLVGQLNHALNETLADPHSRRQIADHGVTVRSSSADQLSTLVTSELTRCEASSTWRGWATTPPGKPPRVDLAAAPRPFSGSGRG